MLAPRLHPFLRLLIAVLGTIAVTVAVVGVMSAILGLTAVLGGQDPAQKIARFYTDNGLITQVLAYPPILLWLWFCRRYFDRRTFTSLGLRAKGFVGQFTGGILCGFLTCAFTFGVLWLSGNIQLKGASLELQSGGWNSAATALSSWALVMLCVGFMEEIMFRGYAFHNLRAWLGTPKANGIQATVFALIHLGNLAQMDTNTPGAVLAGWLAMPNIFLIAIFFTLCYLKTGSLWFPIAFHAAWNFFLGCVFSLPVSGLPIFKLMNVEVRGSIPLTGGSFGPEASLLLTPILLALVVAVSRVPNHRQANSDLESLHASTPALEPISEAKEMMENSDAETEERENRFRTRMGKRQQDLDEETRQTLRALNDAKREPIAMPSTLSPLPAEVLIPSENPAPQNTPPVEVVPIEITSTPPATIESATEAQKRSTPPPDKPKPPAPRW